MADAPSNPPPSTDTDRTARVSSARKPAPVSQSQSFNMRAPKVAIPRMRRESETESFQESTKSDNKHRVSHACEPCRHRKTKCSGERPICKHCEDHRIKCFYADGKRDRAKKEVVGMAEKLEMYETLLRQAIPQLDSELQNTVNQSLAKTPSSASGDFISSSQSPGGDGENFASARAGSTGSLDRIHEDLNRDSASRSHGYMGKQSEVAWLQRVERQLEEESSSSGAPTDERLSKYSSDYRSGRIPDETFTYGETRPIKLTTYHLDELDISSPDIVDEFALPPKEAADSLLDVYLKTVHSSFPILLKNVFVNQYANYFATFDPRFGRRWLAKLNLIFAIGAKYSHLARAPWRGDPRDHIIYLARARSLGLEQGMFSGHGDFEQVQVLTLFVLYLLATDQINRAWITAGHGIRIAQSLGLHLLNVSNDLTDVQKEVAVRVWWSISSLERLLCIMCGRPSAVNDRDISNSMPIPVDEDAFPQDGRPMYESRDFFQPHQAPSDQRSNTDDDSRHGASSKRPMHGSNRSSTSQSRVSASSSRSRSPHDPATKLPVTKTASVASYFVARTYLTILTNTILERLYCAKAVDQTWSSVQMIVADIDHKLKAWHSSLPNPFDFSKPQRNQTFYRQRLALGFLYYGAQLLLKRPYLCRIDKHIPNESARSRNFNRSTAVECVQSARSMIDMIPNDPNPAGLYSVAPWWSLLHHLMQAEAILMLEMSYRANHAPQHASEILVSAKKAARWVYSMSEDDAAARKAWGTLLPLLKAAAAKIGGDTSEISKLEFTQPLSGTFQTDIGSSGTFAMNLPGELDVFDFTQSMYPLSIGAGPAEKISMLWTDNDSSNPVASPGGGQGLYQGHTSALFPTSSQMDTMNDHEMADFDYPRPLG